MLRLLSAHISKEGDVVALTEGKTWIYACKLIEAQQKTLLRKLAAVGEINPEFWIEEIDIGKTDE